MNIITFFTIATTFFLNSMFQIQSDVVNLLTNPNHPVGSLSLFGISFEPIKNPGFVAPIIKARSAILMDQASNKVLYAKNADEHLPIASLTKIMTAIVVLEETPNLDQVFTVPTEAVTEGGSTMKLQAGEKMTVHNLLKGLLIESGNDAAITLAVGVAGSKKEFVNKMNDKAKALGLSNTHFTNPDGFDETGHYSSAKDLAELTSTALRDKVFANIVKIRKDAVKDITGKINHPLDNTNKLLSSYLNVIGVKTGTTSLAGESLVSSAIGNQGQVVIVVLLDSPDRFQEAKSALDWALRAYSWLRPVQ